MGQSRRQHRTRVWRAVDFLCQQHVVPDLTRAGDYARLLASLGINGCTVNNVNASPRMLASDFLPEVARIADAFRPWGVQLSLAVDFSSPQTVGGLDTSTLWTRGLRNGGRRRQMRSTG